MVNMAVSAARATLSEVLARVEAGEEVTLTRHGRPVAVVVRPDALRSRHVARAFREAARLHTLLDEAADTELTGPGLDPAYADELVAQIRADRDRDRD